MKLLIIGLSMKKYSFFDSLIHSPPFYKYSIALLAPDARPVEVRKHHARLLRGSRGCAGGGLVTASSCSQRPSLSEYHFMEFPACGSVDKVFSKLLFFSHPDSAVRDLHLLQCRGIATSIRSLRRHGPYRAEGFARIAVVLTPRRSPC